ncbi:MAG: SpoIVB peptidase S55 domain-containing protein, partial [Oscillospiraceae bacterium]
KHEVRKGDAIVLSTIDGERPMAYKAEITTINHSENSPTKNMIITITDQNLLRKTGGIVQGMSGSPIIQDGKLVGAVTHVFVNEQTKGYAIFAENMDGTLKLV